ncbi:MAG: hypothetical protein Kow0062_04300 [Acidobacteriota bacterium]
MAQTVPIEDERLRALPALLDPARAAGLLAAAVPLSWGGPPEVLAIDVVKHNPGKRCALAYTVAGPDGQRLRLFAKVYRTDRGARIFAGMQRIYEHVDRAELIVPRPLAYASRAKLLVTEFVDGVPLGTSIYAAGNTDATRRAARAVATLHRCRAAVTRRWGPRHEIENTADWITRLPRAADDPLVARARELLDRLAAIGGGLPEVPGRVVHRDFYLEQLFDLDGRTVLYDLDDIREGDPAVDVGNLLAHLTLRGMQFPVSRPGCEGARPVFLEEYAAAIASEDELHAGLADRVRFYEAASLLRLVAVYATRSRWKESLPPMLLDEAQRRLDAGE